MTEEQKEAQTPEGQGAAGKDEQIDYKAKVVELEAQRKAEIEQLQREIRQKEETLDAITPFVDWAAASGQQTPEAETMDEGTKSFTEQLRKIEHKFDASLAAIQFRMENPDLAPYEKALVGPAVKRLLDTNPRMGRDEVLKKAAAEVRGFLEAERKKGQKEAETKEKQRQEELDSVSGLGSPGDTAPEQKDDGETLKQYSENRLKRLEKMKQPTRVVG